MEGPLNFFAAQTPFGILAIVSFLGLFGFFLRKAAKRARPSVLCSGAILLPLLLCSFAALRHLTTARIALESEDADIVNPSAGIQLASELLWVGVGMSLVLGLSLIISVLVAKSLPTGVEK
jgi:purine-cytosine permease-like protein